MQKLEGKGTIINSFQIHTQFRARTHASPLKTLVQSTSVQPGALVDRVFKQGTFQILDALSQDYER